MGSHLLFTYNFSEKDIIMSDPFFVEKHRHETTQSIGSNASFGSGDIDRGPSECVIVP